MAPTSVAGSRQRRRDATAANERHVDRRVLPGARLAADDTEREGLRRLRQAPRFDPDHGLTALDYTHWLLPANGTTGPARASQFPVLPSTRPCGCSLCAERSGCWPSPERSAATVGRSVDGVCRGVDY